MIAVRGPNWLGDTVMALPALQALRAARPDARISLIGRWAPLLTGQGMADIALSYPGRFADRWALGRALAADPPDVAVILPNSLESALAACRWRARRRIGFDADARRPLLTDPIARPALRHQVDEYGLLVEALGARVAGDAVPSWRPTSPPALGREVDALLDAQGVGAPARPVGLHLGAAFGPSKLWPPRSFGQLGARLAAAGLAPLLLGTGADTEQAREAAEGAGMGLPSLVGRDRPALLQALLGRLACLVSGDTGVAHLAAALGVPTVTLFGPTDPRLSAPRGPHARALSTSAPCSPCFLATCPIDHVCLRCIGVDRVLEEVLRVLGR